MFYWYTRLDCRSKIFLPIVLSMAFIVLFSSAVSVLFFGDSSWVYSESGVLEISQSVLLFIAFIYFLYAFFANSRPNERMISLFLLVLAWAFLLREVDFDKMNLPAPLVFMLYGAGRTITVTAGFAAALIGASMHFKKYAAASLSFIISSRGLMILLTGVFLVVGYIFEHKFHGAASELYEEGFELLAYIFFLVLSCITAAKNQSGSELVSCVR